MGTAWACLGINDLNASFTELVLISYSFRCVFLLNQVVNFGLSIFHSLCGHILGMIS